MQETNKTIFMLTTRTPKICQDEISLLMLRYKLNNKYQKLSFEIYGEMCLLSNGQEQSFNNQSPTMFANLGDKTDTLPRLYAVYENLTINKQIILNALEEVNNKIKVKQVLKIIQKEDSNDINTFLIVSMLVFLFILVIYFIDYCGLL